MRLRRTRFASNVGFWLLAIPLALFIAFIVYLCVYLFRW